jgi:hypothetical protein
VIYRLTNSSLGARGVDTILVDPGATIDVDLTDEQAELLELHDLVTVEKLAAKAK